MAAEKPGLGDGQQVETRRRRRPDSVKIEKASDSRAVTPARSRTADAPAVRDDDSSAKSGNFFTRLIRGTREYLEGVRSELGKVAWPSREDTRRLTIIVIIALILSSVALGAVASGFTELFRIGLDSPVVLLGFMVVAVVGGYLYNRFNKRST